MKNHIIISLLFLSVGFSQKEYDINHIVEQNGVYLKKFSDEFVSGEVFEMYGDMKVPLGKMKDGKKEGKWMVWYDNGTKQEEQNYKDGKKNGLFTEWNENQEIIQKGMFQSNLMNGEWVFLIKQSGFGFDNIVSTYDKGDGGNPDEFDDELNRDLFSEFDNYEFISGLMDIGIPINGLTKTIFNRDNDYLEINFKNGYFNGSTIQILNGQKKYEGTWKDGEKEGLETKWYENGQMKIEVTYKDGIEDGLQTYWYENGQKESEGTYKNGEWDGLSTRWYENGQKESEGTIKDGELVGLHKYWYNNGLKKYKVTYKDGEQNGLYTKWYENGQKKYECNWTDGIEDGLWMEWYENGNQRYEGPVYNGEPCCNGKLIYWYENGQKSSETNFKDGIEHGLKIRWYDNGNKEKEYRVNNGSMDGYYIGWDENGNITYDGMMCLDGDVWEKIYTKGIVISKNFSGNCYEKDEKPIKCQDKYFEGWDVTKINIDSTIIVIQGKLHGPQIEFYDNGQKKIETTYIYGENNGPFTKWYESGKKERIGYFKNGELHGTFKSYNEDGRVMGYQEYLDGVPELFIFGGSYDGVEVITKWITTRTESLDILYEWKVNGIITEKQFQEKKEELFKKELYYGEQ